MSLLEQMAWIDRLLRRPADLPEIASLPSEDAGVLATLDTARLDAVSGCHAALVVARWWQPRFPAVLATLSHFMGGQEKVARRLRASPSFLLAVEDDVTAAAFVGAVLELTADWDGPEWVQDLLAYEYLLSTGLPRRGRDDPICPETEEALLADAVWLEGGRLLRPVLTCPFTWPVGELREEPRDVEPAPQTVMFVIDAQEVVEVELGEAADALDLLAGGADDGSIGDVLPEVQPLLDELRRLGVI